jgi:hypothetical protein
MLTEHESLRELLMDYSDQLVQGNVDATDLIGLRQSGEEDELCTLLHLAQQVHGVLKPVRLPMAARERMRRDILDTIRLARSREVVVEPSLPSRGLFIGAAVALAGGIAYLIHARSRAD